MFLVIQSLTQTISLLWKKCFNYNYDCGSTLTKCNGHVDEVMEFDENIKEISDKLRFIVRI